MKSKLKQFVWTEKEDKIIEKMVQNKGKRWRQISKQFCKITGFSKTGRQCRQRWYNHIDPNISRKEWTQNEDDIIFRQHQILGNKWTKIAEKLEGRSDNAVKNHFYSLLRKILRRVSKFLGTKNGTAKVRKIKSSALAKLFSICQTKAPQQDSGQLMEQDDKVKFQKRRQLLYRLINFSRHKLTIKNQINPQQTSDLQGLLLQIDKLNQEYQLKRQQQKIKKEKNNQPGQDWDSNQIQSQSNQDKISNYLSQSSKPKNKNLKYKKTQQNKVKVQQDKINILKIISQYNINNLISEKNIPQIYKDNKSQSPLKIQTQHPTQIFNLSSDKNIMNLDTTQPKDKDVMINEDYIHKDKLEQIRNQLKRQVLNEVLAALNPYTMLTPGNFIIMPGSNLYFTTSFNTMHEMFENDSKKNEGQL